MSGQPFVLDGPALYRACDTKRHLEGRSWRAVGRDLGLAYSTFTRLRDGHVSLNADSLITVLVWLDLDTDIVPFIRMREP